MCLPVAEHPHQAEYIVDVAPVENTPVVIPGLGPGIHALGLEERKAWIPEPGSGMTK